MAQMVRATGAERASAPATLQAEIVTLQASVDAAVTAESTHEVDLTSVHGIDNTAVIDNLIPGLANYSALRSGLPDCAATETWQALTDPLGSGTDLAYNTGLVTFIGAVMEDLNSLGNHYMSNTANGTAVDAPYAVEFDTSAVSVSVKFWGRYNSTTGRVWTWVDGRPITPGESTFAYTTSGFNYYKLTFPDARVRRIRIYTYLLPFAGVRYTAGATFTAPTRTEKKLATIGDSWVEGSTSTPYPWTPLGTMLGIHLNMQTLQAGQGGTGYVNPGDPAQNRKAFGHSERLSDVYAFAPDYVVVAGGGNDDAYSGATTGAAATALYAAISSNLPSAKVFVIGCHATTTTNNSSAARVANNTAISAAASGASNVWGFIDPLTEQWVYGTGHIASPAGDGSADFYLQSDTSHLSRMGAHYYSQRAAARIKHLLAKNGVQLP